MKKPISFSLFATIVILSLIARSTAVAQSKRPAESETAVLVRPVCPRVGYRWVSGFPAYRPRHFRRYGVFHVSISSVNIHPPDINRDRG